MNMASLLPLDEESLAAAAKIGPLLTVEDHHVASGLGASAAVALMDRGIAVRAEASRRQPLRQLRQTGGTVRRAGDRSPVDRRRRQQPAEVIIQVI